MSDLIDVLPEPPDRTGILSANREVVARLVDGAAQMTGTSR